MTTKAAASVQLTVVAIDPPFERDDGVVFGLQSKHGVHDPVVADQTTEFDTSVELRGDGADRDLFGDHVHGRRGDRFVYLSWGLSDPDDGFVMFARTKLLFSTVPVDLLTRCVAHGDRLVAELAATNPRGEPASGTQRPPALRWTTRGT